MACYDASPYLCTYDSGGGKDYAALATWEADSDNDLAGYTGPVILDCYDSQVHPDSIASFDGAANVSATIHRQVQSSASCATPFAGKAGTGANFYTSTVSSIGFTRCQEDYVWVVNIIYSTDLNQNGFYADHDSQKYIGCIAYNIAGDGFRTSTSADNSLFFACISYGSTSDGFNLYTGALIAAICCTAIDNGAYGFKAPVGTGTAVGSSNYAAGNTTADYSVNWDAPSGWCASLDETADNCDGTNYKNLLDLITGGELDADYLPTVANLFAAGGAGANYGRNPYNDVAATYDFNDFLKNDTAGDALSKLSIEGNSRPTPDTADAGWSIGAGEYLAAGGNTYEIELADTLTLSDSLSINAIFSRTFSDLLILSDTITSQLIISPTFSDIVKFSDSLAGQLTIPLGFSDTLTLSDSITGYLTVSISLSDIIDLSDSLSVGKVVEAILSDSVILSDSLSAGFVMVLNFEDNITLSDSLSAGLIFEMVMSDIAKFSDLATSWVLGKDAGVEFTAKDRAYYFTAKDRSYYFTAKARNYYFTK